MKTPKVGGSSGGSMPAPKKPTKTPSKSRLGFYAKPMKKNDVPKSILKRLGMISKTQMSFQQHKIVRIKK